MAFLEVNAKFHLFCKTAYSDSLWKQKENFSVPNVWRPSGFPKLGSGAQAKFLPAMSHVTSPLSARIFIVQREPGHFSPIKAKNSTVKGEAFSRREAMQKEELIPPQCQGCAPVRFASASKSCDPLRTPLTLCWRSWDLP